MAAAKKQGGAAPVAAPPKAPAAPAAREAFTLKDATRVGLFGVEVDATPDHAYTVAGVTATAKEKN
jgi:hypothetical protein